MVSENHPFVGGNKVAAVFQTLGRSGALRIKSKNLGGDELAVKAIANRIAANCSCDQPKRIDLLTAMQSDGGQRKRTEDRNSNPKNTAELHERESIVAGFKPASKLNVSSAQQQWRRVGIVCS